MRESNIFCCCCQVVVCVLSLSLSLPLPSLFFHWKEGVKLFFDAAAKLLFPGSTGLIARQLNIEVNDINAVIASVF